MANRYRWSKMNVGLRQDQETRVLLNYVKELAQLCPYSHCFDIEELSQERAVELAM